MDSTSITTLDNAWPYHYWNHGSISEIEFHLYYLNQIIFKKVLYVLRQQQKVQKIEWTILPALFPCVILLNLNGCPSQSSIELGCHCSTWVWASFPAFCALVTCGPLLCPCKTRESIFCAINPFSLTTSTK